MERQIRHLRIARIVVYGVTFLVALVFLFMIAFYYDAMQCKDKYLALPAQVWRFTYQ